MVALPVRSLRAPGAALAAAGALALSPALVAPAVTPVTAPAQVRVAEIELAGIGLDIYYAITPVVQYVVGGASYLINGIPLVGGLSAAQININYFQGIQPVVEATVNYLAAVLQDPLNFFPTTAAFGTELFDIGYNWVSAQLMFLKLKPLTPLPQGSATVRPGALTRTPAPAATEAATEPAAADGPEQALPARPVAADSPSAAARQPVRAGRSDTRAVRADRRVGTPRAAAAAQGGATEGGTPQRETKAAARR